MLNLSPKDRNQVLNLSPKDRNQVLNLSPKDRNQVLSLNTHDYDGKLGDMVKLYQPHISNASKIDIPTKLLAFARLQNEFSKRPGFRGEAHRNFLIIISDYKRAGNGGGNYDPSNNLHAADLLYICAEVLFACQTKEVDIADIIIDQIAEMSGGMCAQGRTHRLMGILPALLELMPPLEVI